MRRSLLQSLLELAHATSQNLGFAHRDDVYVSYGEETITETNLLELRRRHPTIITLHTFGRKKEAKNGADWEWHIIGRFWTFRMRIQAKRLQKDDRLKIPHTVKSSGKQQIDLLIADAKAHRLKPVYCLYSAERQRSYWNMANVGGGYPVFEAGCLLVDAKTVKKKMPTSLPEIENDCVPWHYLAERRRYARAGLVEVFDPDEALSRFVIPFTEAVFAIDLEGTDDNASARGFPTLSELNNRDCPDRDIDGLIKTDDRVARPQIAEAEYRDRGINRVLEIDIREVPEGPFNEEYD